MLVRHHPNFGSGSATEDSSQLEKKQTKNQQQQQQQQLCHMNTDSCCIDTDEMTPLLVLH